MHFLLNNIALIFRIMELFFIFKKRSERNICYDVI
jgi:hypothetical protein